MCSCNIKNRKEVLSGDIVVQLTPSTEGKCYYFSKGEKKYEFCLPHSREREFDEIRWINNIDAFIGVENHRSKRGKTTCSNLVLLNTKGRVINKIIDSKEGQFVGYPYPSPNDSLLFFVTSTENNTNIKAGVPYRVLTLNIIDFNSKKIVQQKTNFCSNIFFDIQESPWSPYEDRIVYSIDNRDGIGIQNFNNKLINFGVFVYDLNNDSHEKISDKGYFAVWSPTGDIIAYIRDNNIWIYDLLKKKTEILYKAEKKEQIKRIHWSPDGRFLYVMCPKYFGGSLNIEHNEKLIDIKEKKEIDFLKPNIGFNNFSWK